MIDEHRARLPWGARVVLPVLGLFALVLGVGPTLTKPLGMLPALLVICVGALLLAYSLQRFVDRAPWSGLGITFNLRSVAHLLLGVLLGAAVMAVAHVFYVLFGLAEWRAGFRLDGVWLALLGVLLSQAFPEEVLFRGYLFGTVRRERPLWTAVVVSSLVFGSIHIFSSGGTHNFFEQVLYMLMACGFGFALAACRAATGTVWLAVGFHTAHNVFSKAFTVTNPGLYGWEIVVHGLVLLALGLLWLRAQPRSAVSAGR
ncbi:CPBP family intramembrane metalloprotease [Allokutzneria sp. A3M-2-11 16]|uniref:CPBP family intramembrane glutamic endopeptidase n=1 Tax=Allokutzneria sp. A3M-2-11 16 TaxID=2962043 RepID=UPI0020B827DE|nr:type II CAAX endopeptidase family protein [Allokutzneria sp. A3M-2-11 16]MCP3804784.1 CPBP family intramembrane metalloprotease [Allokutzneria sp. A3M-2-11 16]